MSLGVVTVRTAAMEAAFIEALRQRGNIAASCRAAGIARSTAYQWRDEDEAFAAKWQEALDEALDGLESELWRRGKEGVDKPVTYQGAITATYKEYSDTLALAIMKAHRPDKWSERIKSESTHAVTVKIEGPAADL